MAPAIESEETNRAVIAVALRGANRPKLVKMTVSQKTRISRNGSGIELPDCAR